MLPNTKVFPTVFHQQSEDNSNQLVSQSAMRGDAFLFGEPNGCVPESRLPLPRAYGALAAEQTLLS